MLTSCFYISKIPVAAGLLSDIFEEIGVTCVAVVVFGMKDGSYMHNITNVPVSPDPHVFRRYDIGISIHNREIALFGLDQD